MNKLYEIYQLIIDTPNNMDLGKKIRERFSDDAYEFKKNPISKERAIRRIEYLETEIAHEGYWDGWSLQGMREELEWLTSQLNSLENNPKQLELF